MPVLGGKMQRYRVVAFVADVGIGATIEERTRRRPRADAEVQGRSEAGVAR